MTVPVIVINILHCLYWSRWRDNHAPFTRGVGVNASRLLWMEWHQALPNWIVGPLRRFTGISHGRSWKLFKRQRRRQPIRSSYANTLAQTLARKVMCLAVVTMTVASAPSFSHDLRQALTPTPLYYNEALYRNSTKCILYEINNIHNIYKPAEMFWNHLYPTWSKKSSLSLYLCQYESC